LNTDKRRESPGREAGAHQFLPAGKPEAIMPEIRASWK